MNDGVVLRLIRGDSKQYDYSVPNIPAGRTVTLAWMTIKSKFADLMVAALIKKKVTSVGVTDVGQITNDGAGGTAAITFLLTPTNTRLLAAGSRYVFDTQIKLDNGQIDTVERGTIEVAAEVTDEDS